MESLVHNLPLLTHLDISGTNLAGTGVAQREANENYLSSDIPGLSSRVEFPLKFLGLYDTAHSACRRHDIPALTVSYASDIKYQNFNIIQYFIFRLRVMQMKIKFCSLQ